MHDKEQLNKALAEKRATVSTMRSENEKFINEKQEMQARIGRLSSELAQQQKTASSSQEGLRQTRDAVDKLNAAVTERDRKLDQYDGYCDVQNSVQNPQILIFEFARRSN